MNKELKDYNEITLDDIGNSLPLFIKDNSLYCFTGNILNGKYIIKKVKSISYQYQFKYIVINHRSGQITYHESFLDSTNKKIIQEAVEHLRNNKKSFFEKVKKLLSFKIN